MKLESLKSSKFEVLKANEINNSFSIIGGTVSTTWTRYDLTSGAVLKSGSDTGFDPGEQCPEGHTTTSSGWDVMYYGWDVIAGTPVGSGGGPVISGPQGFTNLQTHAINLDNTVNSYS